MIFRFSAVISLILVVIALGLIYINLTELDQLLVLRSNNGGSEKSFGNRNDILQIAVTGLLLILLNIFLARSFKKKIPILTQVISCANIILSLLILITIGGILLNN